MPARRSLGVLHQVFADSFCAPLIKGALCSEVGRNRVLFVESEESNQRGVGDLRRVVGTPGLHACNGWKRVREFATFRGEELANRAHARLALGECDAIDKHCVQFLARAVFVTVAQLIDCQLQCFEAPADLLISDLLAAGPPRMKNALHREDSVGVKLRGDTLICQVRARITASNALGGDHSEERLCGRSPSCLIALLSLLARGVLLGMS
ncbi:hypothetical protein AWV79_35550 [Cupriavidus sp. UYMMa02A]|nr:hypothetical protein AWV79_35550 [Cupriavidus sp. UYMMa02A]